MNPRFAVVLMAMVIPWIGRPPLIAQTDTDQSPSCQLPKLREQLLRRMEVDQAARKKVVSAQSALGSQIDRQLIEEIVKVDTENRVWLTEQVEKHGWLGKTLVGEDGAHAAWLIVQHADLDRKFQKQCLAKMSEMPQGEVSGKDIAYLTDRVLVGDGKKQRYGTQLQLVDGKLQVEPVEDPENLDKLRAAVGLPPVKEYLERASQHFQTKPPSSDKADKSQ